MLVETSAIKPFEVDDLHPAYYRCAKNCSWSSPAPAPQPDTRDILREISNIAEEIKNGVGALMRETGLELPPRSAHVPSDCYDLYPAAYRAMKNAEPAHIDPTTAQVHHILSTVKATIGAALVRLQERVAAATNEPVVEAEADPEEDADLYPQVARACKNRPHHPAVPTTHTLGEEIVMGLQHTVQDLRRKWVHVQAERAAREELDLYPDAYRYAVNHNVPASPRHTDAQQPAKVITEFFDTLSAMVNAAAA